MNCDLCMYHKGEGECSIHGQVTHEVELTGCGEYVEMPFIIGRTPGCCGLSGLPTGDFLDIDEAELTND